LLQSDKLFTKKKLEEENKLARIGVEPTLTNVKEALARMGHDIIDLRSEADADNCDFAVISGQDKDIMGIANVVVAGSVINAQGSNTNEVCQMVNEKLQ